LLLVVALVGVRSFGGSPDVAAANGAKIEIDMVKDGNDWCNPVNNAATHTVGPATYEVAICLTNALAPPASFNIELKYNDLWNSCTDVANSGTGLDDNPDANAGPTVGGTYWPSEALSLGTVADAAWDCSVGGTNYPVCDTNTAERGAGKGVAFLTCGAPSADLVDLTLPVGAGVSSPIAVVTLKAEGAGVDNLAFGIVKVADESVETIVACNVNDGWTACIGATDTKTGEPAEPTATPTATMTPAATNTPCGPGGCPTSTVTPRAWTKTPTPAPTGTPAPSEPGGPGEPAPPPPPPPPPPSGGAMPQVVPPGTGTGSGGGAWTTSLMWTLAGAGALSVFLGGLYLRRARNR